MVGSVQYVYLVAYIHHGCVGCRWVLCHLGHPVNVLLDWSAESSPIATSFAVQHRISRNVSVQNSVVSSITSRPICIPTPSGWFSSSVPLPVVFYCLFDVVLRQDWLRASRLPVIGQVINNPSPAHIASLPVGFSWVRAPSNSTSLSYLHVCYSSLTPSVHLCREPASDPCASSKSCEPSSASAVCILPVL